MTHPTLTLRGEGVTLRDIGRVARDDARVTLHADARERIVRARAIVDRVARAGTPVYGLNTALGANTGAALDPGEFDAYQRHAIEARAVGVGPACATEVVRAMMAARAAGMAVGGSGASVEVVDALIAMLNAGVHPVVPGRGSIGAADLAPLAHVALTLLGEGRAEFRGNVVKGGAALASAGLQPVVLRGKDALALISSNAATLGHAALVLIDAARVLDLMNVSAAVMHEGFRANLDPLDPHVQEARRGSAQGAIASRLRTLLEGSALHRPGAARRLQDPLSFRCITQVHGACLATLHAARALVERDLNAATESPLVVADTGTMISNGNFDTTDIALAFEAIGLALAHVGSIAMQRCQRLYSPATSALPLQLTSHGPRHSGFATAQKTLLSLTSALRHHAQAITLNATAVSEGIEDHASLAPLVIDKTAAMLPLLRMVAAVELISAAQAIDLRNTDHASLAPAMQDVYARVRATVAYLDLDRPLGPEIDALAGVLHDAAWPAIDLLA